MSGKPRSSAGCLALFTVAIALTATAAVGQTFKVLHSFGGAGDGSAPFAALVADGTGQLYGVTLTGPAGPQCSPSGCGVVFKLSPNRDGSWAETLIYQFTGGSDQSEPAFPVAFDPLGNLFGTTQGNPGEYGTVFGLTPNADGTWSQRTIYTFTGGADGGQPFGIAVSGVGRLYGTTYRNRGNYQGLVFDLGQVSALTWKQNVLHAFGSGGDGYGASGELIFDASGNIYGTTYSGGLFGNGTVFKLSANAEGSWNETILYSFRGSPDAAHPYAGVIFDMAGNLYGTTEQGGSIGQGTAFELTPNSDGSWTESVLHSFGSGNDGGFPDAGLTFDTAGNLYGTTPSGGGVGFEGTVFKLTLGSQGHWTETLLHAFSGQDGIIPYNDGRLVVDGAGNIYGTAAAGGQYGGGTVFEITP
jgi:uncharacterized repeat protein (TIGR03803 family)